MAPKAQVHAAAVKLAIPVSERDERVSYLDQVIFNKPSIESQKKNIGIFILFLAQYSCRPPPLFLLLLSLAQISVFVWHVVTLSNRGVTVGPNGPPYIGKLIFNPDRKFEVWRFLSYMLVHAGYFHIVFNVLVQLVLGLPLEMVHRWWRIMLVSNLVLLINCTFQYYLICRSTCAALSLARWPRL